MTKSIVKFQKDFLDLGIQSLKPLVLRDVAEDIQMHESTISLMTNNKYVHTPQGIYELKFFFNAGIPSTQGETVASESVKNLVRELIAKEDPKKPYSDEAGPDSEGVEYPHRPEDGVKVSRVDEDPFFQ